MIVVCIKTNLYEKKILIYKCQNNSFILARKQKIWFLEKKGLIVKNRTFIYECNCTHCQQKLNQINNAKLYWDKLILRKKSV